MYDLIKLSFDSSHPSITIKSDWTFLILLSILGVSIFVFRRFIRHHITSLIVSESNFEIDTGLIKFNQKIKRNYQNLHIANRIYIELITRKAAIEIDIRRDVIVEVYNSWYTLFKIIREEIKSLPGELLIKNESSKELIELTIEILNKGLRPHLTEYQAEFIKWYNQELENPNNKSKSPQQIQQDYPKFSDLTKSMIMVNKTLYQYSTQLKKLIYNLK